MKKIMALLAAGLMASAAWADMSDTLNVSATVGAGVSSLSVVQADLNFGTLTPAEGATRFVSSALTMDAFAANGPWYIKASTANAGNTMGLVDANGHSMLLKMWQPSFGPETGLPDANVDANWRGDAAFWGFVYDDNQLDENNQPLFSKIAQSANEDSTDFNFYLAVDAGGVAVGSYSTMVTFTLVIE